jgi:hypothetical protein
LSLLAALLGGAPAAARAEVGPAEVQRAIERGRAALIGSGAAFQRYPRGVGANALVVLALLQCGVPPTDSHVQRGMETVSTAFGGDTYDVGLAAMALAAVDPKHYQAEFKQAVAWLTQAQNRDGGWRYRIAHDGGQTSDHSCTQFALLGLHAATEAGMAADPAVWRRAANYLARTQCPDGGWAYVGAGRDTLGSMTAASIGSLYLCERHLDPGPLPCGAYKPDPRIARGLAWLAQQFAVDRNPGRGGAPFYYLYALERIGIFSARRTFGSHDWYREGADYLVRTQRSDGTWGDLPDTCFALLFLAKGRAPLLVQKVERDGRWNEDPADLRHLVEHLGRTLDARLAWQHVDLTAPVEDLALSPLLFLSGRELLPFTDEERAKLRRFVTNGGTLLFEAQCSSEQFDADFRAEARRLFPDTELGPLDPDHPVNTSPFAIAPEHRVLHALWVACRAAVLYSPRDLSSAWAKRANRGPRALPADVALRLGTNLAAYVLEIKPLQDRLARPALVAEDKDAGAPPRNTIVLALLIHGGHWNPRPSMPRNLARELSQHTAARTAIETRGLALTDPKLFDFPVVHMTGTHGFELTDAEAAALRQYLQAGGFLFADACAGARAFDAAFRAALAQVFPDRKLAPLPANHPVYRACHTIEKVAYLPPVLRESPGLDRPTLEGIEVDGRTAVIYSPLDIGCALEDYPCPTCRGYAPESARPLAVNLLVYGTSF